eukprot:TRINITY_DN47786_c0_g1_i1.p1 TRINITY_DN47786_c0_g1~~TRINITY_DN47786_c0_g1_i1.p1  ORF type:complete len:742 (+),score=82.08 TRINITY_DN47786_c0_g1_i1:168-2393(+)
MDGAEHSTARGTLLWRFLSNPYCVSAAACGLLAVAVSCYLTRPRTPRLPPRLRQVRHALRRLSRSAFLFRVKSDTPALVLCTQRRALFKLSLAREELDNGIELDGEQHTEQLVAHTADLRVVKRGLFFERGRSVVLSDGKKKYTFPFLTRHAADVFLQLLAHVRDQRPPETLKLFLTTFNVGNSQPPDDLSSWFQNSRDAHVVAIGVQECSYNPSAPCSSDAPTSDRPTSQTPASDDSSASTSDDLPEENITTAIEDVSTNEEQPLLQSEINPPLSSTPIPYHTQSSMSSAKEHWQSLLTAHFPESHYSCIARHSAWDRSLTIFVKKSLFAQVSNVRVDTANVGVAGVMGNKGAIGARFSLFDTEFLIINSHLAAHHSEIVRRNEDFSSIASGLSDLRDDHEAHLLADPIHYTFWMGDLNYRINLDRDVVLKHVRDRAWKSLQEADQLLQEMDAGRVFQGFSEGKTDFPPTYRYERGSRRYSSVKMRIPSYCDRILYRSLPGCNLELDQYCSADEIITSDHSPVFANFRASVPHSKNVRNLPEIVSEFSESSQIEQVSHVSKSRSLTFLSPSASHVEEKRSNLKLVFISLGATDIPDMNNGGRRITVAKALRIDSHLIWKKHDELGEGHYADPYCIFHGPAVAELDEGEFRTETIHATQNPVWNAEQVPKVALATNDLRLLRSNYIIITVKDENPARRDATIGSTILWLGGFNGEDPVQFSAPIMHGGLKRGLIVGRYVIR